jgi:hypothetical protein
MPIETYEQHLVAFYDLILHSTASPPQSSRSAIYDRMRIAYCLQHKRFPHEIADSKLGAFFHISASDVSGLKHTKGNNNSAQPRSVSPKKLIQGISATHVPPQWIIDGVVDPYAWRKSSDPTPHLRVPSMPRKKASALWQPMEVVQGFADVVTAARCVLDFIHESEADEEYEYPLFKARLDGLPAICIRYLTALHAREGHLPSLLTEAARYLPVLPPVFTAMLDEMNKLGVRTVADKKTACEKKLPQYRTVKESTADLGPGRVAIELSRVELDELENVVLWECWSTPPHQPKCLILSSIHQRIHEARQRLAHPVREPKA